MSFPRYPAYKDSGVEWLGEVPAHWDVAPVKVMGRIKGGAGFPHEAQGEEGEELDFHKVNALGAADPQGYLMPSENTVSQTTAQRLGAFVFPSGTIVFAKVGAALLLGRIRELPAPACIDNNMMGYVVDEEANTVAFLRYAMNLIRFDLIANPGAVPSVNESQVGNYLLARPPRREQVEIAAFLDRETAKIDALVAEQKKLIELLKEKRQAVISNAVTKGLDPNVPMKDSGVEWLGEVPAHWEVKRFGDACASISTGPFGTALGSADYVSGGIPVINPSHIVDNRVVPDDEVSVANDSAERLSAWTLRMGDIVVARRGELGRAAVVTPESDGWICGTGSLRVTPNANRATAEFLHAILQSRYAREWLNQASVGSTMANLNEGILARLPVVLTPTIGEQLELTHALEGRLAEITAVEISADACVALLLERRSALISAAVTGQIDVRGLSAEQATAAS